jgi:hypothetical protein
MRFHVLQSNADGLIRISTKAWKNDKVLYTCPSIERAQVYAQYLTGSRCFVAGQCCPRATDRKGREISIPISA